MCLSFVPVYTSRPNSGRNPLSTFWFCEKSRRQQHCHHCWFATILSSLSLVKQLWSNGQSSGARLTSSTSSGPVDDRLQSGTGCCILSTLVLIVCVVVIVVVVLNVRRMPRVLQPGTSQSSTVCLSLFARVTRTTTHWSGAVGRDVYIFATR